VNRRTGSLGFGKSAPRIPAFPRKTRGGHDRALGSKHHRSANPLREPGQPGSERMRRRGFFKDELALRSGEPGDRRSSPLGVVERISSLPYYPTRTWLPQVAGADPKGHHSDGGRLSAPPAPLGATGSGHLQRRRSGGFPFWRRPTPMRGPPSSACDGFAAGGGGRDRRDYVTLRGGRFAST
jgi:hypothetical protein